MILQLLTYSFFRRAIIVGALISICAALLGVNLVLKRRSMIGDGLSHVGFGALAIATAFNFAPLYVSVPAVVLAAFILLRLNEKSVKGDAAIAMISSSALAIGIVAVSMSSGMNVDVNNYMFGSILALTEADVILTIVLSAVIVIGYFLLYNRIFSITFDETFAQTTGVSTKFYNSIIAILTAITVVLGMRMMGTLLISSLIIFPVLSSMNVIKTYKGVIISSLFISLFCFCAGMYASVYLGSPTGASIVVVNLIVYILMFAIRTIKR